MSGKWQTREKEPKYHTVTMENDHAEVFIHSNVHSLTKPKAKCKTKGRDVEIHASFVMYTFNTYWWPKQCPRWLWDWQFHCVVLSNDAVLHLFFSSCPLLLLLTFFSLLSLPFNMLAKSPSLLLRKKSQNIHIDNFVQDQRPKISKYCGEGRDF